jgi:hypothetical protein
MVLEVEGGKREYMCLEFYLRSMERKVAILERGESCFCHVEEFN